jgi:hypothetical protein
MSKEIMDRAEELQRECQEHASLIFEHSDKPVSYQDAVNTWIFLKIAMLEDQIGRLNDKIFPPNLKNNPQ